MRLVRSAAKLGFSMADLLLPSPPGPRILIYHQVGTSHGDQMEVTTSDFRWQIDWLVANRQVLDLDTAIQRWHDPGSDNLVVLTFDDGFLDTYTTVFPLLREIGAPFTIYLATDALGGEETLTWDQVGEMAATGLVTVGAHTHRHTDLRQATVAEVTDEVEESNHLIESRVGSRPNHFAYPWGYWSATADTIVRGTYASAVLGGHPPRSGRRFDPHMIYRFPVQLSDGTLFFRSRLSGGLLLEEGVRRKLRGYRGP